MSLRIRTVVGEQIAEVHVVKFLERRELECLVVWSLVRVNIGTPRM